MLRHPETLDAPLPDGRTLGVRRWPGRGLPLVALHGVMDGVGGWDALAAAVDRPFIALDLPGFGASAPPVLDELDAYAQDVADALAGLEPAPLALLGHSLGGAVAALVAERRAERVETLVLLAPGGFGPLTGDDGPAGPGARVASHLLAPWLVANPAWLTTVYMTRVTNGHPPDPATLVRMVSGAPAAVAGARRRPVRSAPAGRPGWSGGGSPIAAPCGRCGVRPIASCPRSTPAACARRYRTPAWRSGRVWGTTRRSSARSSCARSSKGPAQRPRPERCPPPSPLDAEAHTAPPASARTARRRCGPACSPADRIRRAASGHDRRDGDRGAGACGCS
jgi:pimeloyl-ACP methyl ester carboxylesterase